MRSRQDIAIAAAAKDTSILLKNHKSKVERAQASDEEFTAWRASLRAAVTAGIKMPRLALLDASADARVLHFRATRSGDSLPLGP